jgi:sugar phosphate isomerase/epimerase
MIYVSTGGFGKISFKKAVKILNNEGIETIELSGGKYYKIKKIVNFFNKQNNKNFCLHNYFPVPKKNFVINLASSNNKIYKKSVLNIKKSINMSHKINSKFFSFHAGFLFDPPPNLLGGSFKKVNLDNRFQALKRFSKRVENLSRYAKKKNVKILIENNVITKENLDRFGDNPFLLTSPNEILKFFKNCHSNVGLLLDVGHLKVSSKTLGFDLVSSHENLKPIIEGYHLSDNNGKKDSNNEFSENSWFFKKLKLDIKYISIEVYTKNLKILKKLHNLIKKKYGK